jgi:hypothetical protein
METDRYAINVPETLADLSGGGGGGGASDYLTLTASQENNLTVYSGGFGTYSVSSIGGAFVAPTGATLAVTIPTTGTYSISAQFLWRSPSPPGTPPESFSNHVIASTISFGDGIEASVDDTYRWSNLSQPIRGPWPGYTPVAPVWVGVRAYSAGFTFSPLYTVGNSISGTATYYTFIRAEMVVSLVRIA